MMTVVAQGRRQPGIDWSVLEGDRIRVDRASAAERTASVLRTRITEGFFAPGTQLSEAGIGGALGISRNTLREAFRLLVHERLLVHQMNRGVFVRVPSMQDVVDLYRVRAFVECAAVRRLRQAPEGALDAVHAAVKDGERALRRRQWLDLGTADLRFHQGIAALAASVRVDQMMAGLLAEMRLVFHVMASPQEFHQPYLARNRQILELLEAREVRKAERALAAYLTDAEHQLIAAYPR